MSSRIFALTTLFSGVGLTLLKFLWPAILFIVGWYAVKAAIRFLKKILGRSKMDAVLHPFILTIARMLLLVLLTITCLGTLGVDTTSLITSLGAVGLAVSLAVKDSLTNMAGGVVVLIIKPFSLGDYVEINAISGTVSEIGIFHTVLSTGDNKMIYIPNGEVAKAKVVNHSHEAIRRLDMTFTVAPDADYNQMQEILLNVVAHAAHALKDPAPVVRMNDQSAAAMTLTCRVWAETAHFWDLYYDLNEDVRKAFLAHGLAVPASQLDPHTINP